jgi:septal ring factor EnvC (AmiA/AmiB activator)
MSRLALAVLAALIVAAPAAGDVYSRKHSVDARLSALHARIARAQQLSAQIDAVSSRIHSLEGRVGDVSARLATLEDDLALHRQKLDRLSSRPRKGRRARGARTDAEAPRGRRS